MILVRLFGLIFNVLLFILISYILYTMYEGSGKSFEFQEEKPLIIFVLLLWISVAIPTIFIRQIVQALQQKAMDQKQDSNLLDQYIDENMQSTSSKKLTMADFKITRFSLVLSGVLQIFLGIYVSWKFSNVVTRNGLPTENIMALFFIFCIYMSGIISLSYLKK